MRYATHKNVCDRAFTYVNGLKRTLVYVLVGPIELPEMKSRRDTPRDNFTSALESIPNLLRQDLNKIFSKGQFGAVSANGEIEHALISRRRAIFYRYFSPLRAELVSSLTGYYRLYFRLALAHPRETGPDSHLWSCTQLQPAIGAALEQIRDWYILVCDGENQWFRRMGSTEITPGQTVSLSIPTTTPPFPPPDSWRAPAWLFSISLALVGIGLLKPEHVPPTDSEQRLGEVHTRLLLTGARRVFRWDLAAAVERARNEETAAAGAIPAEGAGGQTEESSKAPKHWLKGVEGLKRKADYSRFMRNLTDKQQLAFSLKYEYELKLTEIASRMGVDRKTAYGHIQAANMKIDWNQSAEKRKANRAKNTPDE